MSFTSLADVDAYVQSQDTITSNEILVLTALAQRANEHGRAFPSLATLHRYTRLSIRTIRYTLRKLEARSAMQTILEPGYRTPTYQLLIPHVNSPKRIPAPHAGVLNAPRHHMPPPRHHMPPNLSVNQSEKRSNARETYRTGARDNRDSLAAKAAKVGITPGSHLWHLMTGMGKTREGCHGEEGSADAREPGIRWVDPQFGWGVAWTICWTNRAMTLFTSLGTSADCRGWT
jgi:hypothetical protein